MSQPSLETFEVSLRKPFSCNGSMLQFLSNGFIFSSIIFNAAELEIFDKIEEGQNTIQLLSSNLNINQDGLERLLNCLVAIGLVTKNENKILANSALATQALTQKGGSNISDVLIHLKRHAYEVFHDISGSIKSGKPSLQKMSAFKNLGEIKDSYSAFSASTTEYPVLLKALNLMASGLGELIAKQAELDKASSLVDLGGGGGQIACDIAAKCPSLKIQLVDLPQACSFARDYIEKRGFSTQIQCTEGSALEDLSSITEKADCVLLAGVITDFPKEERSIILRNAKSILKENGKLLISETLLTEEKDSPLISTILNLYIFISTGGQSFTSTEITSILKEIGFSKVNIFFNNDLGNRDLVVAEI